MEILILDKTIFHTNVYHNVFSNFPRRINFFDEKDLEMIEFALNQSKNILLYSNDCKSEKEKIEFEKNSILLKLRALIWLYVGEDLFFEPLIEPLTYHEDENNFFEWKEKVIKNATEFAKDMFEYKIMSEFLLHKTK